jgi:chitinase
VAFLVSLGLAQGARAADCSGLQDWSCSTSYGLGASVRFNGSRYTLCAQCSRAASCPGFTPAADNWWSNQGTCDGGSPATPTPTPRPAATATPTPTPGGGSTPTPTRTPTVPPGSGCSPAWVSTTVYTGGSPVSRTCSDGTQNYQAAYWTQGNDPCTNRGAAGSGEEWIPKGACGGPGGSTPTPTPTATRTPTPTPTSSGPTPTPTATPTGGPGGNLPRHVITGYWHNFNNGSTVLKLSEVPAAYNLIAVAFADATGVPGQVTFNLDSRTGYSGTAEFINDIRNINSGNRKVIISVGGQNGTISVSDNTSAANFANSIVSLMDQDGFAGVDIDLENGVNSTFMAQALRSVKSRKPNAIITMAPQTIDMQSTGMEYFKLALNIKDILTIVNMQYYNSGSMLGCDQQVYSQGNVNFLTALACIQLQNGLRPDQVGLGLPATAQAAGGGFVSPGVVNNALDCLAAGTNCGSFHPSARWPGIRGAMTWSINWDKTQGYNWVNTVNGHLGQVP